MFAGPGYTKRDLVAYYVAVSEGALRGAGGRPMALKRYVNGADGEYFFQKRAPESRPEWLRTVELSFPSGRTADELVIEDAAGLAWIANLGCLDLNPHAIRADDLDHPDELRIDLDPDAGDSLGRHSPGRHGCPRGARRFRPGRLAQDFGFARHPHQRPDRAPLELRPGPPRGSCAGSRGGAARPAAGHQQVVEGRASRGLPRLQPERQGSDRRLGLLGAAGAGRPGFGAGVMGRAARMRDGRLHAGHGPGAVRADRRPGGRDGRCHRIARRPARAVGAPGEGGPGRRAVAAALRQGARRAAAGDALARPQDRRRRSAGCRLGRDFERPARVGRAAGASRPNR